MLVISRKVDQSIIIDGCIEVVVTEITRDGVRLGISAPKEIQIHRREVFVAIAEANRAASTQTKPSVQDAAALLRAEIPKVRTLKSR